MKNKKINVSVSKRLISGLIAGSAITFIVLTCIHLIGEYSVLPNVRPGNVPLSLPPSTPILNYDLTSKILGCDHHFNGNGLTIDDILTHPTFSQRLSDSVHGDFDDHAAFWIISTIVIALIYYFSNKIDLKVT